MNWLLTLRRLLGRFWYDCFEDSHFLLGVEHLLSYYSQLVENQYLNWRNGMIAKDLTVEQDGQPFIVYLDTDVVKEWKTWEHLWDANSAVAFVEDIAPTTTGWITYTKNPCTYQLTLSRVRKHDANEPKLICPLYAKITEK